MIKTSFVWDINEFYLKGLSMTYVMECGIAHILIIQSGPKILVYHRWEAIENTNFDNKVLPFALVFRRCNLPCWFVVGDWIINNRLSRCSLNNMATINCQNINDALNLNLITSLWKVRIQLLVLENYTHPFTICYFLQTFVRF